MKKRSILFLIIALITLLTLLVFSSCDGDENVDGGKGDGDQEQNEPTESITLDKTELSLQLGTSHTLTVSGIPAEHS